MVPSLQRVHLPIPFLCPSREELVKHWRDNVESAPRDVYPLMVMTPMPTIELFHGVGDARRSSPSRRTVLRPARDLQPRARLLQRNFVGLVGPQFDGQPRRALLPDGLLLKEMPDEACKIVADVATVRHARTGVLDGSKFDFPQSTKMSASATLILRAAAAAPPRGSQGRHGRLPPRRQVLDRGGGRLSSTFRSGGPRARPSPGARAARRAHALPSAATGLGEAPKEGRRRGPGRRPPRARVWGANYRSSSRSRPVRPDNMFRLNHNVEPSAAPASPPKPKPRRSLSGRVLSALSPGKKK